MCIRDRALSWLTALYGMSRLPRHNPAATLLERCIRDSLGTMKKDEIIVRLKEQLQLANEQLQQANATVSSLTTQVSEPVSYTHLNSMG